MVKIATPINAGIAGAAGLAAGTSTVGAAGTPDDTPGTSPAPAGYAEATPPSPRHPFLMRPRTHTAWMVPLSPFALTPVDFGGWGASVPPGPMEMALIMGALLCTAGLLVWTEGRPVMAFAVNTALHFRDGPGWRPGPSDSSVTRPPQHSIGTSIPMTAAWHYYHGTGILRDADRLWDKSGAEAHVAALAFYKDAENHLHLVLEVLRQEAQPLHPDSHRELSDFTPHPYELLGHIALRRGGLSEAIHWWTQAAYTHLGRGELLEAAWLRNRLTRLLDRHDPEQLPEVIANLIIVGDLYSHAGLKLPEGTAQDQGFRNRDEAVREIREIVDPFLDPALRSPEGRDVYRQLKTAMEGKAPSYPLSPPWFDVALMMAHNPTQLPKYIQGHMAKTMAFYDQHRLALEKLHPRIAALRQAQEPPVSEAMMNIMKDWANQLPALRDNFIQVRLPHERARAELPLVEAQAAEHAWQLEDPAKFRESVTKLLNDLATTLHMQPNPEMATGATSAALAQWIEDYPGWGGTFIDLLLHHWRDHPDLMWQTVGTVITAHPGWVDRWQQAQIYSWAEVEPRAKLAWDQIEAAHPDITLVR